MNKGSNIAVFRSENTNANAPPMNNNDEIKVYQLGLFISSNEDIWRIIGFHNYGMNGQHGQQVFFGNKTEIDSVINPPKTILIILLKLCNRADYFGVFVRT
jgi:hypothetical protein|uniref:Uncharacterized protein n=1 Tax=Sipha flava TaxID=143950 RepID=A0A2S2QQ94_9HEMI